MESFELADDIWPLLRRNTDYVPEHISDFARQGARYQVFEVLITWIITEQNLDFDWKVTPVQGDGGVDFIGKRSLLKVPGQKEFVPEFTILGQCKVRNQNRSSSRSRDDAHSQLESDFRRSIKTHTVSEVERPTPKLFIGCLADKIPKPQRAEAEQSLSRLTTASVTVLDLDDIVILISNRMDLLNTVLVNSNFSPSERARINSYFASVDGSGGAVEVSAIARQDTVFTNDVAAYSIQISSACALPVGLKITHDLPENSSIELLGHSRSRAYSLRPDDEDIRFASDLLLLRTPSVGQQSLGSVTLHFPSGERKQFDIGHVTAEYSFRHSFYWTKNSREILSGFCDLLQDESQSNTCPIFGIVGAGGSGKSRLIEELMFNDQLSEWRSFTLRQSKDANRPYKLILDLLSFVSVGETEFQPSHQDSINKQLSLLQGKTGSSALSAFEALTRSNKASFDVEALAFSVAALLRNCLRHQSTILHFADMHQTPSDVLRFIGRLASLISIDSNVYASRLAFVIEGRDASHIDRVNHDFERQLTSYAEQVFALDTLNAETNSFIDHILRASLNETLAPDPERTAQFNKLKKRIARVCGGNPMFIIETIRLFVERGYLRADPRTGALYLMSRLPESIELPSSIEDCLIARMAELQRISKPLAELVIACGTLDDSLDVELFDSLREELAPSEDVNTIFAMGVLVYSMTTNIRSGVRFAHEYYFHAVHGLEADAENQKKILEVFRAHIAQKDESAQRFFDQARIEDIADIESPTQIEARFKSAWSTAIETEQGYLEYRIGKHVSELWQTKMNLVRQQISNADLCMRQAQLMLRYDDRQYAVNWLSSLLDALKNNRKIVNQISDLQSINPNYLTAKVLTGLGSAMLNQFFGYLAIENLSRAVKLTSEALGERGDETDHIAMMWRDLNVKSLDRLGCALRIDGRVDDAYEIAKSGMERGRLNPRGLAAMHAVYDFGRLEALHSPEKALHFFEEAREILRTAEADQVRHNQMINVSEDSANVLLLEESGDLKALQDSCAARVEALAYSSYGLEVGASYLNASAAFISSDPARSLRYAEAAINWNMERNYLELLWKSHHNACIAAQLVGDQNLVDYHVQRCFNLIVEQDIARRPEPFKRQRMIRYEPTLRRLSDHTLCGDQNISLAVQTLCAQAPSWENMLYKDYLGEFSEKKRGVEAALMADQIVYAF